MVAKAGLGIIGLGAISVGGVALAKPYWLGMADPMPSFHFLSEDQSSADSSYSGKFGDKYKNYLVGVANKKNGQQGENKTNKDWWNWAYRRLSNDKNNSTSKKFKQGDKVDEGFIATGSNTNKSLHKVCEAAYGTNETDFGDTEDKFKKDEVWKYCSPGLLTHTKEDKDKYADTTIGGKSDNKSTLVSVEDKSNDWFWEQRNKDFWTNSGTWSGSSGTSSTIFKTEYEAKKDDTDQTKRKTIKDLCKEAYGKGHSGEDNNEKDAKKFCVLEATATQ